ncbi:HID1-like protein [Labeo rohita]|uniref:HID1-like protein n=1 Tax=Labeo rohita TaxID=84645 RepID=A0A498LU33_LABRO|nr:HID1-like protein [Labeo rohita]
MGNSDSKLHFRKAVIQLTTKTQPVEASEDVFWDQFWTDVNLTAQDIFALVPAAEIRAVREESPSNLATLCYKDESEDECTRPLAESLLTAISDLLFCPDFTVESHSRTIGYGIPYNHLMFSDQRGVLTELALQTLIVSLEQELIDNTSPNLSTNTDNCSADYNKNTTAEGCQATRGENLFVNYLSRIHREEDFNFILRGIGRLLNNPLLQTYLPHSCKKIQFHQELLVLFWKLCDLNKKFLFYVLKSSDVLDILVPVLFYLNDARANQSRAGLVHIGVFILLLLSGERNFGVRLNKPYSVRVPMDISVFAGTHADLLIVVFHKIITCGHQRLQPLYDCLLTIIVNVSPYLKSMSMVAANKLIHLLEVFSSPWFLFCSPVTHHLVFFLLEIFNNIIQYQFDGNCNLVYGIIRKRSLFHQLANLPTDVNSIQKALQKKSRSNSTHNAVFMETNNPYNTACSEGPYKTTPVQTGTLNTSLKAMPRIDKLTETSQVSEDGTTVLLQQSDAAQSQSDHSSETQVRDAEPTSGEDDKESEKEDSDGCQKRVSSSSDWAPTPEWVQSWKSKLPLQTIMRLLQVLVPQVEKICIDRGLTDESEILKFLQHGTLVGLLPVPHPILIRKYQANEGTALWFRTYIWGLIYLRNVDPPVWYDTDVKLFEIQRI